MLQPEVAGMMTPLLLLSGGPELRQQRSAGFRRRSHRPAARVCGVAAPTTLLLLGRPRGGAPPGWLPPEDALQEGDLLLEQLVLGRQHRVLTKEGSGLLSLSLSISLSLSLSLTL